jgi:hypothetical protein
VSFVTLVGVIRKPFPLPGPVATVQVTDAVVEVQRYR